MRSAAAAIMDAAAVSRTSFAAVSRTSFAASPAHMPVPAPRRRTPTCRRGASVLAATGGAAVEGGGDEDARITVLKAKLAVALQGVVRASPRAAARIRGSHAFGPCLTCPGRPRSCGGARAEGRTGRQDRGFEASRAQRAEIEAVLKQVKPWPQKRKCVWERTQQEGMSVCAGRRRASTQTCSV